MTDRRIQTLGTGIVSACLTLWAHAAPDTPLHPDEADEATAAIEVREGWRTAFGGDRLRLHVLPAPGTRLAGTLGLALHTPGGRAIWRDELQVEPAGLGTGEVPVEIPLPEVKPGVVMPLVLRIETESPPGAEDATWEQTFWVFPPDPFHDRKQWLRDLGISLYDPVGKTAAVLEEMEVPLERIHNKAALGELREGLILIGEGLSFHKERGLFELLLEAASRGLPVLCLAPSDGKLPLPDRKPAIPRGMTFRHQDVIRELDKRLDAEAWPADGSVVASTIALSGAGSAVVGEVGDAPDGWPWVELRYPPPRGIFLLCGFAVIEKWEESPTPRYLFASLLERLTAAENTSVHPKIRNP